MAARPDATPNIARRGVLEERVVAPGATGSAETSDRPQLVVRGLDRIASAESLGLRVLVVVAVGIIGLVDWATGPDLAFSGFYLLPVFVVSAAGSLRASAAICGLASLTWLTADLLARGAGGYHSAAVPVASTLVRFATFFAVGYLVIALRQTLERERRLARTDPLSGLLNTRAFFEGAEIELARMARQRSALSIVYIDIDGFKRVNDQFGHDGGDALVVVVGEILSSRSRMTDLAARLGGDEFTVLLPDTDAVQADHIVDDMRAALESAATDHGWIVGFSAGIVEFGTPPDSVDAMVRAADQLMYEVKRSGKGATRTHVMTPPALLPPFVQPVGAHDEPDSPR